MARKERSRTDGDPVPFRQKKTPITLAIGALPGNISPEYSTSYPLSQQTLDGCRSKLRRLRVTRLLPESRDSLRSSIRYLCGTLNVPNSGRRGSLIRGPHISYHLACAV